MEIRSERCIVRPFKETDIDDFMIYRNDMDWMRYQGFKGLTKQEYSNALLKKISWHDGAQLAIICKKTNCLIGDIYLKQDNLVYWIGYTIIRSQAGQGYACEVVMSIIEELSKRGAKCIKAGVEPENAASIALLHKLKFNYLETDDEESIFVLNLA